MQTFLVDCWLVKAPNWIGNKSCSLLNVVQHLDVTWWGNAAKTSSLVKLQVRKNPSWFPTETTVCSSHILALSKLFASLSLPPVSPSHFCPSWSHTGLITCDFSKARYMSINTRACLYALKCKLIVVLFSSFLQFSLSFFQSYKEYFL